VAVLPRDLFLDRLTLFYSFLQYSMQREPVPTTQALEGLQIAEDFGTGPIGGADEAAANAALAVDHVSLGPLLGAVFAGGRLLGVADGDEVDVAADEELLIGVGVFVDADGEDGVLGMLVVELGERGQLEDAGLAPACPEVKQHDLAPVVGQMDRRGAVGYVEVGGRLAGLRGMAAAVTTGEGEESGKSCGDSKAAE